MQTAETKAKAPTRVFLDEVMPSPLVFPFASGTVAVYSTRGPDKETPNEDAAALLPYDERSGVLVVADGLGGGPAGERAAALAVTTLKSCVVAAARDGSLLRSAIIDGLEKADAAVGELGVGAATTLAAVEIHDGAVRPYHIGDSVILVTGNRGKIKLQTVSHSPLGYAVESGMFGEEYAMHHDERHLISNALGTGDMRIEIGPSLDLAPRDSVILATDGLVDNLHTDEIIAAARKGPIQGSAAKLAREASERMVQSRDGRPSKPDDVTLILFRRGPGG